MNLYKNDCVCSICNSKITTLEVIKVSENDYVEIQNNTDETISIKGLFLSGDLGELLLWQMPTIIIRPGQSINIVGDDYSGLESFVKRGRTNFDMSGVEKIYLSSAVGDVVG